MLETTHSVDIAAARDWLRQRLSPERFAHSLGAQDKVLELAEKFNFSPLDRERASLAALLHDSAKLLSPTELLRYCEERGLPVSDADRVSPQTLHPFVGAEMVREAFCVDDEDILNAIRYHTTARAGMSRVEKVVYIADKIEGNTRNPLYIQKMTAGLDCRDAGGLDKTMLFILDSTISFLMDKHQVIHPRTIEARNDFIMLLRKEGRL